MSIDMDLNDDLEFMNSSKFLEHLHTNYIPSQAEIPEIKAYAASAASKMTQYDNEIEELEVQTIRLRARRARLQMAYDAHMDLVSPFRRLPPEIVQVIFGWCLPTHRTAVMHASEAPLLLGRVCSDWRRLLFATPAMWASVHIVPPVVNYMIPGSSTLRFEKKRDIVETWLRRAGTCPLDISFVWLAGDSQEESSLCEMLIRVLFQFAGRWRSLDFQLPLQMFHPFSSLQPDDTPLLQSFMMVDNRTSADRQQPAPWPDSLQFINGATRLRSFALTVFMGGIRMPNLPLSELTILSLESNMLFFFDNAQEMLDVLSECQKLQRCTLRFPLRPTASQPFESLDRPITFPRLTFLCIDCDQHLQNTFHVSNTIGNFIAPSLRQLELMGRPTPGGIPPVEQGPNVAAALQKLLRKSACPLTNFTMEFITLTGTELVECLELMPCLTSLSAHDWSTTMQNPSVFEIMTDNSGGTGREDTSEEKVLKALTCSANDRVLCPRLEQFNASLYNVSQSLFCDFAASRVRNVPTGVTPLKLAKCTFTTFEDKTAKARLDELQQEGLNVITLYRMSGFDEVNPSPWTGLDV